MASHVPIARRGLTVPMFGARLTVGIKIVLGLASMILSATSLAIVFLNLLGNSPPIELAIALLAVATLTLHFIFAYQWWKGLVNRILVKLHIKKT